MNTISITGKGSIHVVPDVTRLETTVDQWFKTYEEAYAQARENSSWFVKILEYNHKPGKLAKTVTFDISDHEEPKYTTAMDAYRRFPAAANVLVGHQLPPFSPSHQPPRLRLNQ